MEYVHQLNYSSAMRFYSLVPAFFLVFISIPVQFSSADALWDKALRLTDPVNTERAVSMQMRSVEKNREGEVIKIINRDFLWDNSTEDFILIMADENGKDVTRRELRRIDKQKDNDRGKYVHQIFNPEKADRLTLTAREDTAVIDGRECRIYDFRLEDEWPMGPGKPKPVVEEGMIFIELVSGMPLRLTSSMVEGPDIVEKFEFSLTGGPGSGGLWRVSEIKMDFAARMIIYRAGGFTMKFNYNNWKKISG